MPTLGPAAQALLDFLHALPAGRILSGQHNYISVGSRYSDRIEAVTGCRPLVWGSDLSFKVTGDVLDKPYHCGPMNITDPGDAQPQATDVDIDAMRAALVREAIEQHRRGHIITLMWHACFPSFGDEGPYDAIWQVGRLPTQETWDELCSAGTELHAAWLAQVDGIAGWLARLRDAGVPVLWRPYHEMNGVWFWWCNKPGESGFARLWRLMHERFTEHHGLANLLWVWNSNAPRDRENDEAWPYADFYPGGDVVDVLAADVYRNDYKQSHHDELLALAGGRPIALGEVGELPTPAVLDDQPAWRWFMPWGALALREMNAERLPALYADERLVALADVERDGVGRYALSAR